MKSFNEYEEQGSDLVQWHGLGHSSHHRDINDGLLNISNDKDPQCGYLRPKLSARDLP